jgi:hypothetical protein
VLEIVGEKHRRHPATAQLPIEPIPAGEGGAEPGIRMRQRVEPSLTIVRGEERLDFVPERRIAAARGVEERHPFTRGALQRGGENLLDSAPDFRRHGKGGPL